MDIQQLSIFITMARSLNFTQTAREHYITQPAVSYQITELERELNAKLFNRSSHHVELTPSGREFLPYAVQIMNTTRMAQSHIYNIANGRSGHIRLLSVSGSSHHTIQLLSAFHKRYPEIVVDAEIVTGGEQINAISDHSADLYITFSGLLKSSSHIACHTLSSEKFSLVYREDVLGERANIHDFSLFQEVPLVCETKAEAPLLVGQIFDICRARGYEPRDIQWCQSGVSVMIGVNAGFGFSLVPSSAKQNGYAEALEMLPLDGEDSNCDYAIGWEADGDNPAVQFFLEVVRELYPCDGAGNKPD